MAREKSLRKHDIGFALMNQLSVAEKHFPRNEQDIAADYFALRKSFHGSKWIFSEGNNAANPNSHCDIEWAGWRRRRIFPGSIRRAGRWHDLNAEKEQALHGLVLGRAPAVMGLHECGRVAFEHTLLSKEALCALSGSRLLRSASF